MNSRSFFTVAAMALVMLAGAASLTPAAVVADTGASFKTMIAEKGPAIVTLKFILKGGEQDEESESTGVLIDGAKGLVLTSNNAFGGMAARFGGPTPTPSDIKVLIGEDVNGLDATFVARDSELGLAWVQLKDAPASPLAAIDLSKGVKAELGEPIYTISLMGKFFDRVPSVAEGRVGAVTKKPRELYIPSIGLAASEQAMPVFNGKGEVVGISTIILPDQEEMMNAAGGARSIMRGITGGMILPASDVASATVRALETAASGTGEAAAEAPADKAQGAAEAAPADAPKEATEGAQPK